jgi:hypothetical protein
MNLANYKKAIWIDQIEKPNDPNTSFKYKTINVFETDDIKDFSVIQLDLKEYIPTAKDKLYFYPGCDVPRYKVRSWGKDKDVSITNNSDKATHIIAGVKTIRECVKYGIYSVTEKADVYCTWLDQNYPFTTELVELKNAIKATGNSVVYINKNNIRGGYNYNGLGNISKHRGIGTPLHKAEDYGFKSLTGQIPGSQFNSWVTVKYVEEADLLKLNEIFDPKSKIYSEKSLIGSVNEDSAIIDQEMYKQIKTMFKSTNREDQMMALSIMSNCNVKPSLHFLLLLLQEFSPIIVSLKEHKHVNFKSLLKYLALPNWDNLTVDDIIQCLMDKEELTMEIVKEVAEGVKHVMQDKFNTKHFKINSITVSEDVKNYMLKRLEITQPN